VSCQLQFPSILRVTSQQPVDFQERLRDDYPYLVINRPIPIPDIDPEQSEILEPLQQMLASETYYTFTSEDSQWQVSLGKDFIELSTGNYKRYEDFIDKFKYVVELFEELYKPSSYVRIGLRYKDLILPSSLDIKPDWTLLINKHLIPELHVKELANSVTGMQKVTALEFEGGKANLIHGIVEVNDSDQEIINEQAYLIDTDFFTDKKVVGTENVYSYLANFNKLAGQLFRWSITDKLHQILKPQPA
jgi:uncharacterized protein (TIGR04255 family)